MARHTFALLCLVFSAFLAKAQSPPPDSIFADSRFATAIINYNVNIGTQAELYNGREYLFAPKAYEGSPFYRDTMLFVPSYVKFNSTWYKNIPLLYDDYRDVLVATRPTDKSIFMLKDSLVNEFYLENHHFVHITSLDSANAVLKPGFYEKIYQGKTLVLAKQYKSRTEAVVQPSVQVTFTSQVDYFIKKSNVTYNVSSKNSVLKVFNDKKSELTAYLKKNNLDFKKDKTTAIISLAAYYDQLSR